MQLCLSFINFGTTLLKKFITCKKMDIRTMVKGLNFICDAPARSLLKEIVEHGAYFACEKCSVEDEWMDNRMTYLNLNESLRIDESFIHPDLLNHIMSSLRLKNLESAWYRNSHSTECIWST